MTRRFAPVELQGKAEDLLALREGLIGFASDPAGPGSGLLWLKGASGQTWVISVASGNLDAFEVFTLAIDTSGAFAEGVAARPICVPADAPEWIWKWAALPRVAPKPPEAFEPWPLQSWRVDVLRRADWIVGYLQPPPPTFGDDPVALMTARPGEVPPDAWAACEVAAGLLFTDSGGRRLLIAPDRMPFQILVTQQAAVIDAYAAKSETVELTHYVERIRGSAP